MSVEERRARAIAAIVGHQVADAAAVTTHWVYDPAKVEEACAVMTRGPAFMVPCAVKFYTPPEGGHSCYGDQSFELLQSLAAHGKLDVEDLTARTAARFGKDSTYEVAGAVDPDNWPNTVQPLQMPIAGPWRHGSIKKFLTNYVLEGKRYPECGGDDEQVDGAAKIVPLVALYAGHPSMLEMAEVAIRAVQNTDLAVRYGLAFARCLEQVILGKASTPADAVRNVIALLGEDESAAILTQVLEDYASLSLTELGVRLKPADVAFQFLGFS